jgi:hypothetical protein
VEIPQGRLKIPREERQKMDVLNRGGAGLKIQWPNHPYI